MAITSDQSTWLKRGSTGQGVSNWQTTLKNAGYYNGSIDGSFGPQTEAATRAYQQANGLSADGVVGAQTWNYSQGGGTGTTTKTSSSKTTITSMPTGTKPVYADSAQTKAYAQKLAQQEAKQPGPYQDSPAVLKAKQALEAYEAQKPGPYKSKFSSQIEELYNKILNREAFSYDFNADPLYQMYRDQYQQTGRQAAADVQAQAAGLSGGYGNSYGATAASQAYQNYLQQLNNVIPELQNQAYQRYSQEGADMRNNLAMVQGLDETDYGRYRDDMGDWFNELQYKAGRVDQMSNQEYNQYLNDVQQYNTMMSYLANRYDASMNRDLDLYGIDMNQYNQDRSFAYQKEQDELAQAMAELAGSGSSGGGSRSGGGRSGGGRRSGRSKSSGSSGGQWSESFLSQVRMMDYDDAKEILDKGVAEGRVSKETANQILTYAKKRATDNARDRLARTVSNITGGNKKSTGGKVGSSASQPAGKKLLSSI